MSTAVAPNIRVRETKNGKAYDTKAYASGEGSRHIGTFPKLSDAFDAQARFRLDRKQREAHLNGDVKVGQFASGWPDDHPGTRIPSSMDTARQGKKPFVEDFGDRELRSLSRRECREWALAHSENAVSVARTMLSEAIADDLLDINPLSNLRLKKSRGRKDLLMISSAQFEAFENLCLEVLNPIVGSQILGIVRTSAYLGLRKCEAFATAENWFHARPGEVWVDSQMGDDRSLRPPKTGKRRIALTPQMLETLRRCDPHPGPGPLFRLPSGKAFTSSSFYYYWKQVVAASGIDGFQFHELRHFHATWLRYQGIPTYAIAVQLGHSQRPLDFDLDVDPKLRQTEDYIHDTDLARDLIRKTLARGETPVPNTGRTAI